MQYCTGSVEMALFVQNLHRPHGVYTDRTKFTQTAHSTTPAVMVLYTSATSRQYTGSTATAPTSRGRHHVYCCRRVNRAQESDERTSRFKQEERPAKKCHTANCNNAITQHLVKKRTFYFKKWLCYSQL